MAWYPMKTAKSVSEIKKVYLSTDDPELISIAKSLDVETIESSGYADQALGNAYFQHGYNEIIKRLGKKPNLIVLLFCNAATISIKAIVGIEILRLQLEFDSAVTLSRYNMWSPLRARPLVADGSLQPFVPFETL